MAKRKIIKIDEKKCNGCGVCIPNCPEGALQVIDGKARLVSDLFCDGLGACIGHCPRGAIKVVEREAHPYDERRVMENIVKQGRNVILAHLKHLKAHDEVGCLNEAVDFLKEKGVDIPLDGVPDASNKGCSSGCPGSKEADFTGRPAGVPEGKGKPSELRQWPVQLQLVSPTASFFRGRDVVLAADCTAYALGGFHDVLLRGKSLAIACPKLDEGKEVYVEKLRSMFDDAKINTLTVVMMQVPCCQGLLQLALQAAGQAKHNVPIKAVIVGIEGDVQSEEWVSA
ncbi:MAG: 4Fe-4S binding protein [Candidatus Altiarchaeota archaeon]|nr:4Fe-4S binding protein [Candidatus Altiarchaeota archaeon]